ncbi:hypothetical protein BPC006_II0580 [Burkholderia pseudomallei BPC006]|nr:hypothetical protein BPC006_II0580 [Burkholderia pseudomallei BPC006]
MKEERNHSFFDFSRVSVRQTREVKNQVDRIFLEAHLSRSLDDGTPCFVD